jgi:NNP family nitrate/nitrite transporter-like MFS transporter
MSNVLLPWFQAMTHGNDTLVWRTVSVVPATMALVTGVLLYRFSDDTPRGNYADLKREDSVLAARRPLASFCAACWSSNTWVLVEQYACCSGVEKVMVIAASYYFRGKFGLCKEAANSIEAIFGWLDFFARPLGGIASDYANHRWGMRGRLWVQAVILLVEGGLILALAWCQTLAGSIAVLVLSSLFVKAAKGSTFAVVPYVSPLNTGSVIGLVAAGGSAGTIAFDFVFDGMSNRRALNVAGGIVMASSVLTAVISIRGHRGLFFGMDRNVDPETGELRGKDSSNRSTTNSYGDREVAVETANL